MLFLLVCEIVLKVLALILWVAVGFQVGLQDGELTKFSRVEETSSHLLFFISRVPITNASAAGM